MVPRDNDRPQIKDLKDMVLRRISGLKRRKSMSSGSTVTTAWRVLGLRIEETASRYGG
jgi:hypothetical protein